MKHMNRRFYFPDPFNFTLLFVVWLLLTHQFHFGNILLAAILAWLIPLSVNRVRTMAVPIRKPLKMISFLRLLLVDIIISNLVVAKQVLGAPGRLQPGFVAIPLDLRKALPITILASTISLSPGTVSIEITKDRKTLFVHALHVDSETKLIGHIKNRYEKPLKEIFGC
jgi:multicomponent K+:H+ antiporter subunit E